MTPGHKTAVRDLLLRIEEAGRDIGVAFARALDPHHAETHDPHDPRMERVLELLQTLNHKVQAMSDNLDTSIATLVADNAALKAAVDAAPAAIATLVATAVAAAIAAGATPAQLQSLADLHTALGGETTQLQAALAGTPPVITPVA